MRTPTREISIARAVPDTWRRVSSTCMMVTMAIGAPLLWGVLALGEAAPSDTIGVIDFFGYQGLDVAKVRAALPVRAGDPFTRNTKALIEDAVERVIGKRPTDVARVCCDGNGRSLIYVGLPGGTYKPFVLDPAPAGRERLPAEILSLEQRVGEARAAAVRKGGDAAQEDDSQGYALSKDPAMRALQLEIRAWALLVEQVHEIVNSYATRQESVNARRPNAQPPERRQDCVACQSFVRDTTPNSHADLPGEPSAAFRSSKVISRR
jgi:hypothetical protein